LEHDMPAASPENKQHDEHNHDAHNHHQHSHHSDKTKTNLTNRLNRIEGQIRGIKGLIERDTYCDDVLNQIASVQSALNGVGKLLLEEHMKSCVVEKIQEGDLGVINELLTTINKLMK
jgi:CsoR family transcriptional regulator, copper-sensing transcriptional repressor